MSGPNLIKQDQQAFNKAADSCSNHRMVQVGYEAVYSNKFEYGDPIEHRYTYICRGSCKQSYTTISKN